MASKQSLPVMVVSPQKPTLDAVRQRLGGRDISAPGAGEIVAAPLPTGEERPGVVLFASPDTLDVWMGDGIVRRVSRESVQPLAVPHPQHLLVVSSDVRLFDSLQEGQRVRCGSREGRLDEGKLLEKCRYGALIVRDDGVVVAAGFQRVWPAHDAPDCN